MALNKKKAKRLTNPMMCIIRAVPEGATCLKCHSHHMVIINAPLEHWSVGTVKCKTCGESMLVKAYLEKRWKR